jgi:cobalamin synthase
MQVDTKYCGIGPFVPHNTFTRFAQRKLSTGYVDKATLVFFTVAQYLCRAIRRKFGGLVGDVLA